MKSGLKTTLKKRKRDEIEDDDDNNKDELTAVFVDTTLDTHVVILVSPLVSISRLKEQIMKGHLKCFPKLGMIEIPALKVKRDGKFYHLSESVLLRTAFHGIESWFVFADVTKTPSNKQPPKAQPILVQNIQSNLVNCEHVSNNQIPNSYSKNFENKAVEIGLNISSPEASKQQKKKKKKKHKSSAITRDDLASSRLIENITKFESKNAVEQSLLETKGSTYRFEGIASEQKRLVGRKDDLPKDEVCTSNVLPSKVVESSAGSQTRKEERSDGKPDTIRYVHDASVPTDAQSKTDKLKGTHGVLGQPKGVSVSVVRKSKKRKKNGGDGADRIDAAKLGEGPDTMRKDVAAFDNAKIPMDRELDGMDKRNDDSKLLSSQREAALYSIEKAGVNEEVVAPLKSVELKLTDSGNTFKKMKSSKKSKKPSEKDVDDTINERHVVQQSLVPDIKHNNVTSLSSETSYQKRDSNNKTTNEEEIKESGETEGLMSPSKKNDLSALYALPSKAVQSSTVSETAKKGRKSVGRDTTCQALDISSVSTDAPAKTVTAEGTPELLGQLKGGAVNQESLDQIAEVISGSRAKKSKKRKKGGVDGVDKIHAVMLDDGSDIMRKDVAAFDNEKFSLERKLGGTSSLEGSTPLNLTNDSQLLLSQHEAALCSVESAQVKFEDVAPLKSLELKITESGNSSKKSKSSKKTKKANENNGGHATQLGHVPDIVQDGAAFICERESEHKRTGDREINESGETKGFFEGGVRRKDDKQKDVVAESNVQSSKVVESSTSGETAEKERIYGDRNTTGDDAPEKTVAAKETPELLGQLEGTGKILDDIFNQESVVHNANAEAISGSRVKVSKKRKKGGVDGVDKNPASKLDKGSDIIKIDVSAFDHEKITLERKLVGTNSPEVSTPLKLTNDSQLLLSQRDAAICSVESGQEKLEDVSPLKSLELKITESKSTSKKRKSSKKSKKLNENNGSHAIMQDSVTALDSEILLCESQSDNKRTGDREIKESEETKGFFEAGVCRKDDHRKVVAAVSNVPPFKVAESSTASEAAKKDRIYGDRNTTGDASDASSVPTDAPEKTVAAKGAPELLCQLEGCILNLESVIPNPEAISGGDGDEKIHASKLGKGSDIMRKDVAAFDCDKITMERELDGINVPEGGTPLQLTEDSQLLLSQREAGLCSVESTSVNEEDVASLKSLELKTMGSGNISKKRIPSKKIKKPNEKDVDGADESHAAQLNQVPDVMQTGVSSLVNEIIIYARDSDNKNTTEEELKESIDTVKKRKTHKTKTSATTKQDLSNPKDSNAQELGSSSQDAVEILQPADTSKPQHSAGVRSKPRTRSSRTQELINENLKELAASKTVTVDCLRENGRNDLADQSHVHYEELNGTSTCLVSANVVEGAKVDKPKESKVKAKKSKQNEICQVNTEIKNDNLEAVDTEQTCVKGLEPARNTKLEESSELSSEILKKRSKSKQTSPAIDAPVIPVTEQADNSVLANSSLSGNKHQGELGDREHEHVNEIFVKKVSTHEAKSTSKSERKKRNQPSSADTSSGLMALKKGFESEKTHHQIDNDVQEQMRMIGVESIQPPEITKEMSDKSKKKHSVIENNLSNLPINQSAIKTQKMVVEQADDAMLNSNAKDNEIQEKVLLSKKRHDGLTKAKKLDKQPASKVKAKKLNLSSSVDTSCCGHDVVTSEKGEGIVRVGSELQNGDHESEPLSQIGTKHLEVSVTHPISQSEEHLDLQNVADKKTAKKMPKFSASGLHEVEQPDVLKTNANGFADKFNKGLSLPEEHYNDRNVIVSQEISSGLKEMTKPQKLRTGKQKVKNLVLPSSVDAESKEENLTVLNKKSGTVKNSAVQKPIIERDHGRKRQSSTNQSSSSKEEMGIQVPIGGPVKSRATALGQNGSKASGTSSLIPAISPKMNLSGENTKEVQKMNSQEREFRTPSIKEQPMSALPFKRSVSARSGVLFGGLSSDSSDDEVERGGSSDSTRTPDDLSSSDYSEGETGGEVVTSPQNSEDGGSARDKTNFNLSALKNMDLESVLRSSRRFKKAKLVASQSQLEDGESEPPEFVPDSQA